MDRRFCDARYPIVNKLIGLPAGLLDARDQALGGHFAELDTAEAEFTHVTLGTTGEGAAVVETYGASVLRELVKSGVIAGLFQSSALLGVLSN